MRKKRFTTYIIHKETPGIISKLRIDVQKQNMEVDNHKHANK